MKRSGAICPLGHHLSCHPPRAGHPFRVPRRGEGYASHFLNYASHCLRIATALSQIA
ncbi:MAG: hypothetical protein FWD68_11140 [Alphaproteobacteria bacterium]|nr:hypothetical protein [Alphaproteobacteria bacterium]